MFLIFLTLLSGHGAFAIMSLITSSSLSSIWRNNAGKVFVLTDFRKNTPPSNLEVMSYPIEGYRVTVTFPTPEVSFPNVHLKIEEHGREIYSGDLKSARDADPWLDYDPIFLADKVFHLGISKHGILNASFDSLKETVHRGLFGNEYTTRERLFYAQAFPIGAIVRHNDNMFDENFGDNLIEGCEPMLDDELNQRASDLSGERKSRKH